MDFVIKLDKVTKSFDVMSEKFTSLKSALLSMRRARSRKVVGLNNITLSVAHGETLAIIGQERIGQEHAASRGRQGLSPDKRDRGSARQDVHHARAGCGVSP
jgi:ABC-type microcin C transport system duplicated ATPase subunit YejF